MKKSILLLIFSLSFPAFAQTWDNMANLPIGLSFPVVVALNGEIHVIGGGAKAGATDIHLRYKPGTNKWDTLAPVPYKAQQPSGAVVDGKIHYFGGGYPNSGTPLNAHFSYDPSTNKWTKLANLPKGRVIMEAASINGKLYGIGGQPDKTLMEEYDPATDKWTTKNPLPDANFWYSSIVVVNGNIYRFGGGGFQSPSEAVHKYDAVKDSFIGFSNLPEFLHAPAATAFHDYVILSGGYNGGAKDKVWLFNTSSKNFKNLTPLPDARAYHRMVTIDSFIYCIGGDNSTSDSLNIQLLRFKPAANLGLKEEGVIENGISISQTNSNIVVKFLTPVKTNKTDVVLYDLTGKTVLSKFISIAQNQTLELNTEELKDGAFYIMEMVVDGRIVTFKFLNRNK